MSQSNRHSQSPASRRAKDKPQVDFLCKVKYANNLPDVPFEGKFLPCPFVALDRFVEYKTSLLEREHKWEVLCEADMGVNIDLINPATYVLPRGRVELHPKDQELLLEESVSQQNLRRSLQHSKVVPFMRKTEYIGSEFNRFGVSADRQEIKVGYNLHKQKQDVETYRDKQSQVDAIAKTFLEVKKKVKRHYSKKDVYAVEELPVLPDFDLWKYSFAQVTFDADPSVLSAPESIRRTMMEQGQIRGMQDDTGVHFVTYFCPDVATIQKRMEDKEAGMAYDPNYTYTYPQNREYTWVVRNKGSKEFVQDTFFLSFRDGNVYYNELGTSVKLTRRRKMYNKRAILNVRHIEPSEEELAQMENRVQQLLDPHYEAKVEEQEEEEVEAESSGEDGEGSREASVSGEDEDDAVKKKASRSSDSDSDRKKDSDDSDSD